MVMAGVYPGVCMQESWRSKCGGALSSIAMCRSCIKSSTISATGELLFTC